MINIDFIVFMFMLNNKHITVGAVGLGFDYRAG